MKDNKKKGVIKRLHPNQIFDFLKNYFFASSWWIANLGVDPCWRFLALRRAPIFLWRRARLFSVTLVLETISLLRLSQRLTLTKRRHFLPSRTSHVKSFVLLGLIIPMFSFAAADQSQSLFLAIGEHSELKVPDLKEFSVSNNDTLSNKYRPNLKTLLLRGKKQGHSEVVIWNKDRSKQVWNVYVLSRSKHLQWMERIQALNDLGLQTSAQGRLIKIEGEIQHKDQWHAFREISLDLENQKDLTFLNQVRPSKDLQKENMAEIYDAFLNLHADDIDCQSLDQSSWITCNLSNKSSERKEISDLIAKLSKTHFIKIQKSLESANFMNYKIKLHLFKLEKINTIEADFTVEKAAGSLSQLNRSDLIQLAKQDDFSLGEVRFHLETVADPEIIVRFDKPFEFQMGSEIPYTTQNENNNSNTNFRFAGLRMIGSLTSSPMGPSLDYTIELSAPASEGQISGNKKTSSVLIHENKDYHLFKLEYSSKGLDQKSLPYIGSIPVLGALFSETQKLHEEKLIIGIIRLERINE